ncbi:unnamed protein product [Arabis nemorensis]|uniref:Phorbol-ester/DAG-type domain-containing protein n=1 Tax=Arabis nemorensis TaxID=586526 RepID=A0A565AN84_9BRAS|nr:unnamed protein product [Arabis nemorensis]
MVQVGHHAYSCKECDFLGHIECILRKEAPSPMYLKALYSCGKDVAKGTNQEVNDIGYIHVLSPRHMDNQECTICHDRIFATPWKCEACKFQAHENCAKLAQPSRHRLHSDHDLTLLPS